MGWTAFAAAVLAACAGSAEDGIVLSNGLVEVRLVPDAPGHGAEFRARASDGVLRLVGALASAGRNLPGAGGPEGIALCARRPGLLDRDAATHANPLSRARRLGARAAELSGEAAGHRLTMRLSIPEGEPRVRVEISGRPPPGRVWLEYLLFPFLFLPDGEPLSRAGRLDFAWLPNLRPEEGQVGADHNFRCPAVMAQKGGFFAAIVPDVVILGRERPMPQILDLDLAPGFADAPFLAYGFADWRLDGHSYYRHDPGMAREIEDTDLRFAFDLFLRADAPDRHGYAEVVRWQWDRYGRAWLGRVLPQTLPFGEYGRRHSYPAALAKPPVSRGGDGWFETDIGDLALGGVIGGWHMDRGWIPNQSWFLNQRSAYGMALFGAAWGDGELLRKARRMKELALAAPQRGGIFPAIFDSRRKEWVGTLVAPEGGHYHTPDASWKCLWLLQWHRDVEPDPRILEYCRALGDFLIRRQEPSGAIPTWFTEDLEPHEALRESAGTAASVWFLAELHATATDPRFLGAARKGAEFLVREVLPDQKYFDFETFYSCSPKPLDFQDPHTGIAPQNTLSIQWTAEALRRFAEVSGERRYLDGAARAIDLLCLYQAVWPISFRKVAYTYGGFGVQNTDAEYNDARQSQFACTLLDFGRATGRADLLERGVAALRAGFTLINTPENRENGVYPDPNYPPGLSPENCGHGSGDTRDGRTGFDWGEGSALAGAAYALRHHGGAVVDLGERRGLGIDGVRVAGLTLEGDAVAFWLLSPLLRLKGQEEPWPVEVRFTGLSRESYRVAANGKDLGSIPAGRLKAGIAVKPVPDFRLAVEEAVEADGALRLTARAEGPWAPAAATLHWRRAGEEAWRSRRLEGAGSGGWRFAVPLDSLTPLEYRLEAEAGPVRFTSPDVFPAEAPHLFRPGAIFDFEGGLEGWEVSGSFGPLPTASTRSPFNKAGERFIGTCEDGKGGYDDGYTGELRSPPFTIRHPRIGLLVGGGRRPGSCAVALVRDRDGAELFRETGGNSETMTRRIWDVRAHRGESVRLVIVDRSRGGWGHINVDDVRYEPEGR